MIFPSQDNPCSIPNLAPRLPGPLNSEPCCFLAHRKSATSGSHLRTDSRVSKADFLTNFLGSDPLRPSRQSVSERHFALDWLALFARARSGRRPAEPENGAVAPGPRRKLREETEMPDVHISWLAGRTVDQKRKVVEGITKVLMEEAGAKPESTHIVFIDIPHTDFASGGMLVADKNKKA
jgi:4-oxalocrotonate tautomerase